MVPKLPLALAHSAPGDARPLLRPVFDYLRHALLRANVTTAAHLRRSHRRDNHRRVARRKFTRTK